MGDQRHDVELQHDAEIVKGNVRQPELTRLLVVKQYVLLIKLFPHQRAKNASLHCDICPP